jgi:osmotically-inducible protein OsmY
MRKGRIAPMLVAAFALSVTAWSQPAAAQQPRPQAPQMNTAERMLEDQLYVRLAERAWVGGDFRATVNQGVVTLSGTVPSEQSKQKMLRIARQTAGVTELRDQLRVDPSVSAQRDARAPVGDSELAKRVAQKIAGAITGAKAGEEWWFSGWRVEGPDRHWNTTVEADNGAVTLEGDVPYDSIVRKSVEAALQVPGVRSVRSEITIERTSGRYSPYYGYGPYGYGDGYPYGPPYVHDFRGFHAMTGEVTKIDPQKGTVTLKTDTETFDLHFPPAFLQNVKQGSKITVELGLRDADGAAASPRTDSLAGQERSGTKK